MKVTFFSNTKIKLFILNLPWVTAECEPEQKTVLVKAFPWQGSHSPISKLKHITRTAWDPPLPQPAQTGSPTLPLAIVATHCHLLSAVGGLAQFKLHTGDTATPAHWGECQHTGQEGHCLLKEADWPTRSFQMVSQYGTTKERKTHGSHLGTYLEVHFEL